MKACVFVTLLSWLPSKSSVTVRIPLNTTQKHDHLEQFGATLGCKPTTEMRRNGWPSISNDDGLRLLLCADILPCKLPLLFQEATRIFPHQTCSLCRKHNAHSVGSLDMSHYNKGTSHHGPRVSSSRIFKFVGSLRREEEDRCLRTPSADTVLQVWWQVVYLLPDALDPIIGCSSYQRTPDIGDSQCLNTQSSKMSVVTFMQGNVNTYCATAEPTRLSSRSKPA